MLRNKNKPAPDARILQIRAYEDKLQDMKIQCAEQINMGIAANWEVCSDRKIDKNSVLRELRKLKGDRNAALDTRREELAQKLYREEEALRSELVNSKETPEERRRALATRAKALWETREAERQAEASSLLDRHFRENCSSLRQEFSKKTLSNTMEVRARQVEDNTRRRVDALREEAAWAECEAFEGFKADMAGVSEARKRADDKHRTERLLDEQLRDKMKRQADEDAQAKAELEAAERVREEREAAMKAREAAASAATRALSEEIRKYNEEKIESDRKRTQKEREADAEWMRGVLAREAEQIAEEAALRERQKLELHRWLDALKTASHTEAMDQKELDAMVQRYQDEQWAKYDAKQKALADARAALAAEVAQVRARQVADRAAHRRASIMLGIEERQRLEDEQQEAARLEASARVQAQQAALRQRLDMEAKIAYNAEQKRIEELEKRRTIQSGDDAEAAYQARIRNAAQYEPPSYFGRPKHEVHSQTAGHCSPQNVGIQGQHRNLGTSGKERR